MFRTIFLSNAAYPHPTLTILADFVLSKDVYLSKYMSVCSTMCIYCVAVCYEIQIVLFVALLVLRVYFLGRFCHQGKAKSVLF